MNSCKDKKWGSFKYICGKSPSPLSWKFLTQWLQREKIAPKIPSCHGCKKKPKQNILPNKTDVPSNAMTWAAPKTIVQGGTPFLPPPITIVCYIKVFCHSKSERIVNQPHRTAEEQQESCPPFMVIQVFLACGPRWKVSGQFWGSAVAVVHLAKDVSA